MNNISQVYPDDFGEFRVRATNACGMAEASVWVGEMPVGEEYLTEQEPDLPAWCNKVIEYILFRRL